MFAPMLQNMLQICCRYAAACGYRDLRYFLLYYHMITSQKGKRQRQIQKKIEKIQRRLLLIYYGPCAQTMWSLGHMIHLMGFKKGKRQKNQKKFSYHSMY